MSETAHKILADISEELTGRLHEKGTLSMTEAMALVDEKLGTGYTKKSYDDYILADPNPFAQHFETFIEPFTNTKFRTNLAPDKELKLHISTARNPESVVDQYIEQLSRRAALSAFTGFIFGVDLGKEETHKSWEIPLPILWTETQHRVRPIDIRKGGWGR